MIVLFYIFRGPRSEFPSYEGFISLNIALTLTNSADADEMPRFVTFHLGLHCLSKYALNSPQYTKS